MFCLFSVSVSIAMKWDKFKMVNLILEIVFPI